MVIARKYVLKSHFQGLPKREDLEIVEEELPPLKDGEFLTETLWLSVDPYMRLMIQSVNPGDIMRGEQVARIIESKNPDYKVGEVVVAHFGWSTHTIVGEVALKHSPPLFRRLDPSIPHSRPSTAVGVLGMPGATAYFGFLKSCSPKPGETLVVTGAAGAVGSAVGQIAKIKGCRVVGFAGSDDKVAYLKSIGFDEAINYKTVTSLSDAVKKACPNGVDMFFDNVGGEFFEVVLSRMNTFGRVAVCGFISQYNLEEAPKGRPVSRLILGKQLKVEGIQGQRWASEWPIAFKEMAEWIQEGKLKYAETVTEGFEKMFDAFLGLFKGENLGKAVVKV
ncbi:hypothetical protein EMCRGX_G022181 [Ephydatia muelleri]|eukprot:Em0009g942a